MTSPVGDSYLGRTPTDHDDDDRWGALEEQHQGGGFNLGASSRAVRLSESGTSTPSVIDVSESRRVASIAPVKL